MNIIIIVDVISKWKRLARCRTKAVVVDYTVKDVPVDSILGSCTE